MSIDPPSPKSSSEPKRPLERLKELLVAKGYSPGEYAREILRTLIDWIETSGEPVKEENMQLKVGKRYRRRDSGETIVMDDQLSQWARFRCLDGYSRAQDGRYACDKESGLDLIEELPDEQPTPAGGASDWKECGLCKGDGVTVGDEPCPACNGIGTLRPRSATPSPAKPDEPMYLCTKGCHDRPMTLAEVRASSHPGAGWEAAQPDAGAVPDFEPKKSAKELTLEVLAARQTIRDQSAALATANAALAEARREITKLKALLSIPTTIEAVEKAETEMAASPPIELPESLRDPRAVLDRIKASTPPGSSEQGTITGAKVYDRELSAEEVKADYEKGSSEPETTDAARKRVARPSEPGQVRATDEKLNVPRPSVVSSEPTAKEKT